MAFGSVGVISRSGGYGELHLPQIIKPHFRLWILESRLLMRLASSAICNLKSKIKRSAFAHRRYFFRSTRNLASSLNVSPRSPKLSSSANASLTKASALRTEASMPNREG